MCSANSNLEIQNFEPYTTYGECRCCLAKGLHRDTTKEYYYNDIKEVYRDLFLECFNLSLSPHNGISLLICESCVLRLRDAASFRMMVVATEDQLLNALFKSDPDNVEYTESIGVSESDVQHLKTEVNIESEFDNIDDDEPNILQDIHSILEYMSSRSHHSENLEMDDIEDADDLTKDELVIDEDDEGSCGSVTLSATSFQDDEPWEIVKEESELLARFPSPVPPSASRSEPQRVYPEFDEHLKLEEGSCGSDTLTASSCQDDEPCESFKEESKLLARFPSPVPQSPKRSEPQRVYPQLVPVIQHTTEVKIKSKTDNIDGDEPDVLQHSTLEDMSSKFHHYENLEMNDREDAGESNDEDDWTEEELVIDEDVEYVGEYDNVPVIQHLTAEVKIESGIDNVGDGEPDVLQDIHSTLENMSSTLHHSEDLQMNNREDDCYDEDDWTEDELVIDEDLEYVGEYENEGSCRSVALSASSYQDDEPWEVVKEEPELLARFPSPVPTSSKWSEPQFYPQFDEHLKKPEERSCRSVTLSASSCQDDDPWEVVKGESKLLARFPSPMPPLPKQKELQRVYPQFHENLKRLKDNRRSITPDKIVKSKIEWFFQVAGLKKEPLMTEEQALALNAVTIFECSNASAFKTKIRNGYYSCFYCRAVCRHDKLREHQENHDRKSIFKCMSKYSAAEFVIYADITDLKCTICKKDVKNLIDLRSHLTGQHSKKIYETADRIIPFKLKEREFDCQVCGEEFEKFGAVEKHMNSHFGSFTCEYCGDGFITKHSLFVHKYTYHKDEKCIYQCKVCKKSFGSKMKYRIHIERSHQNMMRYVCTKCPERFISDYRRRRHLVDVHAQAKAEPVLYKCSFCEKDYTKNNSLYKHVKNCHTERSCEHCSYTCYTNYDFEDHMTKHFGKQMFQCPICKKSYGSKRSRAMHFKIHKPTKCVSDLVHFGFRTK